MELTTDNNSKTVLSLMYSRAQRLQLLVESRDLRRSPQPVAKKFHVTITPLL